MKYIEKLKNIINIDILLLKPKKLEKIAQNYKNTSKFPNIKTSFEYPPKPMDRVMKLFIKEEFEKLNFFDIVRLLMQFERDIELENIDKTLFIKKLDKLYNQSEKSIKNSILKIVTKISLTTSKHSFKYQLLQGLTSHEFLIIKFCIRKEYSAVQREIKNKSLKNILKQNGVYTLISESSNEYAHFLLEQVNHIALTNTNIVLYSNNLFFESNLKYLYQQIEEIINIIEKNINIQNSTHLDTLLINKLGNINESNSKWHSLQIPLDLQSKYKKLKGIFEFQRFIEIVEYLTTHPNIHFSSDENSDDKKRLKNRSTFWSNYDERFSSVKIWVSEKDYQLMNIDNPLDLNDIQQLVNINNEACMLEFKDHNLLIIEFFRLRDGFSHFNSLIFEGDNIIKIKERLSSYPFTIDLLEELKLLSNLSIRHSYLWQGWVDKFLRDKGIYPNISILNGKKFTSPIKIIYKQHKGLESTRRDALKKNIKYEDIILSSKNVQYLRYHP